MSSTETITQIRNIQYEYIDIHINRTHVYVFWTFSFYFKCILYNHIISPLSFLFLLSFPFRSYFVCRIIHINVCVYLEMESAPRNVQVRPLSSSTMVITWEPPETPNGQVTVSYNNLLTVVVVHDVQYTALYVCVCVQI